MTQNDSMARPREFDRDIALEQARQVFWAKGYAGASTDDLISAMGIGRQSLYNTFGDKWQLYVEALTDYQQRSTSGHVRRLEAPESVMEGLQSMLEGLVADDDEERALGCMGVVSACEFGTNEPELVALRGKASSYLRGKLLKRIREGQASGEISESVDAGDAASYVLISMTGIQLAARSGAKASELRRLARFAAERLRA
jgi:AcrR family transcriptional regulator